MDVLSVFMAFYFKSQMSRLKLSRQNYVFPFLFLFFLRLVCETRLVFETVLGGLLVAFGVDAEKVVTQVDGDGQQEFRVDALLVENTVNVGTAEADGFCKLLDAPPLFVEFAADEVSDGLHGASVCAASSRNGC